VAFLELVIDHVLYQSWADSVGPCARSVDAAQSSSSPARGRRDLVMRLVTLNSCRREYIPPHCDAAIEALRRALSSGRKRADLKWKNKTAY